MKTCTRCGSRNDYSVLYCTACGNDSFIAEVNSYRNSDTKNILIGVFAGMASMLVVVLCVFAFFTFRDKNPETKSAKSDYHYDEDYEDDTEEEEEEEEETTETTTEKQEPVTAEDSHEGAGREDRLESEPLPTEPYYAVSRSKMYSDDYILPSDTRYLTYEDLDKFGYYEIDYVTNEIYARHGYIFGGGKFSKYFEARRWYRPVTRDMDAVERLFSVIEKANIETIVSYEEAKGWREKRPSTTAPTTTRKPEAETTTKKNIVPSTSKIPDVVGMNISEATEALEAQGFTVEVVQQYSDETEGTVLSQSLPGGTDAPEGTLIILAVSEGPEAERTYRDAYIEFLEADRDNGARCEIADVTGDGEPELLLEEWGTKVIVYTYDAQSDSLVELAVKGMGKGYAMPMYYSSEKCQVILPTANTGGGLREVVSLEGGEARVVKSVESKNGKHSDDGENHFYVDGNEVTQEEYNAENDSLADGFYGVDLTIEQAISKLSS